MTRNLIGFFTALILGWALPGFAQENSSRAYTIGPEPRWLTSIAPSTPAAPVDVSLGVAYLLHDRQVEVETEQDYTRVVKRITSESGVQNESQLHFAYEPSHQTIQIHKILLRRDGQTLDRLKPEALRVIQAEKDSVRHIFNGEQEVLAILEDVRVGDEIEYAFTVTGFNPIFGKKYADAFWVDWSVPMHRSRARIVWPKNRGTLKIKIHGKTAFPSVNDRGDFLDYEWDFHDLPAVALEERVPGWFNAFGWIQVSAFADWKEVGEWALPLYTQEAPGQDIQELAEGLRRQNPERSKQILAALQFVQDEVRYLGIEIGPNSHKPSTASTALSRRFGDCKDKTVLLCSLLKALGVAAEPALVNTYLADRIAERLPSPLNFNHVIARVRLDEKTYWLDATRSHQRGDLQDVSVDDYLRAFPVNETSGDLEIMAIKPLPRPTKIINEHLAIESYEKPAALNVTTVYDGEDAVGMRALAAESSREELQKLYLNFYQNVYQGVTAATGLEIKDDTNANRVTVIERYHVERPWSTRDEQAQHVLRLQAFGVTESALLPRTHQRKMPINLRFPVHVQHTISIDFPGKAEFTDEKRTIVDAFQKLNYEAKQTGKNLTLNFVYETLQSSVPVAATADFRKKLEVVHELCTYNINLPKTGGSAGVEDKKEYLFWPEALGLAVLGGLCYGARRYYLFNPPLQYSTTEEINPKLRGLRGWLWCVALGLILSPFFVLRSLFGRVDIFTVSSWNYFTSVKGAGYHPLLAAYFTSELIFNLLSLTGSILGLIMFFKKRAGFPRLYITLLLFNLLCTVIDFAAAHSIPALAVEKLDGRVLFRTVTSALIWVVYTLKSKRVRATFVN